MTAPDFGPQCSKGWGDRCAHGRGRRCRCACGGANHGRANPASAVHTPNPKKRGQLSMLDDKAGKGRTLNYRADREALFYGFGEVPERIAPEVLWAEPDDRTIVFRRGGGMHDEDAVVLVRGAGGEIRQLEQRIRYHSDGLEFGYGGSGPADCALNILALVLSPKEAVRLHQDFKMAHVATVPQQAGGVLPMATVRAWIAHRYATEQADTDLMEREAELRKLAAEIDRTGAEGAADA